QRHCRLGRRDGRNQYQTRRIPRRVELHYLAEGLSPKLRVYFLTSPKDKAPTVLPSAISTAGNTMDPAPITTCRPMMTGPLAIFRKSSGIVGPVSASPE